MTGRVIAYATYVQFAIKYKIPTRTKAGNPRTAKALQMDIYKHESILASKGVKFKGLYFN